ncbi:hypothetical protein B0H11DRAFT_2066925 [Mycena galericulata]|nr:hypothetical protein B0H11DRAFT_2066925 [Mycena galericulata]
MLRSVNFHDLALDVILSIFAHCDVATVVATGQTCHYMHDLAFRKSVWLILVGDLRRRSILNATRSPNLQDLTTEELVKLVRKTVSGPATWSPPPSGFTPEVSEEITLHPKVLHSGPGISQWGNQPELLRSGRHVLFKNGEQLECWDVAEDRLLWMHVPAVANANVLEFAGQAGDGDSIIIIICERTYPNTGDRSERKNYVEIVQVDLETGKDDLLMITRALDSYHDNPFHNVTLSVSDAVASVTMLPGQHTFLMLHWTKQYSLILTCNSDPSSAASVVFLVPRHIVLKTESREGGAQIHIISSEVFDTYFAPAIGVDGVGEHAKVSANNLPKLGTMSGPHIWECVHKISLHACALHHDTYRLWVHGSTYDVAGGSSSENVVSRYDLLLHPGRLPQWHHRASHSVPETLYHGFTYTGHSLYREWSGMHQTHQIVAPTSTSTSFLDGGQLDLPKCSVYIDVSPYSGAITFSTSTSIFIRYFK